MEDSIDQYRLTESIILHFLRNDCNISGTDKDFDVKVIGAIALQTLLTDQICS